MLSLKIRSDIIDPQVTLGVPFYGRFVDGGDWRSYEDIVEKVKCNLLSLSLQ